MNINNDEEMKEFLLCNGYKDVRKLINGKWVGIGMMLYTWDLFVGLTDEGYKGRYSYLTYQDVLYDYNAWNGESDPKGNWIKYKGEGGERSNKNYTE